MERRVSENANFQRKDLPKRKVQPQTSNLGVAGSSPARRANKNSKLGLHRLVRGLSLVKDIVRTQGRLRAAWQAANDKARRVGWIA